LNILSIYNGSKDWNIPTNLKDLIDIKIPEKYIPSFEYYKIIQKDIPDEVLLKIHNLASAIIYLEKKRDEKGLKEAIDRVVELIKKESIIDIRMFTIWFKKMFKQKVEEEEVEKINNLMEVKSMLTLVAEKIEQKGIQKGIQKGAIEGKIEDAKRMLEKGFNIETIIDITRLPKEKIENLRR
ncbi:MAG: Rpn family recombination-promoting nuclease/putative transposase, partial [Spirochaetes bacterium]|nr:Rpn family recombination-promoting nuclease/putative transposase [Spirochaetota bacterium]